MRKVDAKNIKRLLISRTDNIGDVVLTLPMASILKKAYPHIEITFLARDYVAGVIAACPHVDHFLSWDALKKDANAAKTLRNHQFDMVMHVFPNREVAYLARRAKIPLRVGTSRRGYHILSCNRWIRFSRRQSDEHEALLNLKLLGIFDLAAPTTLDELIAHSDLNITASHPEVSEYLDATRVNIVMHPFSNGNGREWPLQHYIDLVNALPVERFNIVITGLPAELPKVQPLLEQCPTVINAVGKLSLDSFIGLLSRADIMLASSTGPLHVAAALGIHAIGVYPPAPKLNPARWAPIGKNAQVLVEDKVCNPCTPQSGSCPCMHAISPARVKNVISAAFNK